MPGVKTIYAHMPAVKTIYARMPGVKTIYAHMPAVKTIYARMPGVKTIYARMPGVKTIYARMPEVEKYDGLCYSQGCFITYFVQYVIFSSGRYLSIQRLSEHELSLIFPLS